MYLIKIPCHLIYSYAQKYFHFTLGFTLNKLFIHSFRVSLFTALYSNIKYKCIQKTISNNETVSIQFLLLQLGEIWATDLNSRLWKWNCKPMKFHFESFIKLWGKYLQSYKFLFWKSCKKGLYLPSDIKFFIYKKEKTLNIRLVKISNVSAQNIFSYYGLGSNPMILKSILTSTSKMTSWQLLPSLLPICSTEDEAQSHP